MSGARSHRSYILLIIISQHNSPDFQALFVIDEYRGVIVILQKVFGCGKMSAVSFRPCD